MVPTFILGSVRNLRFLSPVSVIANVFEFYTLAVVFYYIFRNPLPDFHSRPLFASWSQLPLFFGTAMFTFEGNTLNSIQNFLVIKIVHFHKVSVLYYHSKTK